MRLTLADKAVYWALRVLPWCCGAFGGWDYRPAWERYLSDRGRA